MHYHLNNCKRRSIKIRSVFKGKETQSVYLIDKLHSTHVIHSYAEATIMVNQYKKILLSKLVFLSLGNQ